MKLSSIALTLVVFAASGAASCGDAGQNTYYISPAGSDDSEGTAPGKAWKTLDRANKAALHAGDSVLLEGGRSFPGNLLVTASGNETAFITIGSYGTGPATIQAGDSFGIRLLNCQYIKVRDLVLLGSGVKPDGATTESQYYEWHQVYRIGDRYVMLLEAYNGGKRWRANVAVSSELTAG